MLFSLLLALGSPGCNRSRPFEGYNGNWWKYTPQDQKLGFIEGFVAFNSDGCRKELRLCADKNELEPAVSSYYEKQVDEESTLVVEVIRRAAKAAGMLASPESEIATTDQSTGSFDGQAWLKYSAKKRLGFVEGYLNALMPQTSQAVKFPKGPEYYANALTGFYTVPPAGNAPDDTRQNILDRKIGEVLWSMRNQR